MKKNKIRQFLTNKVMLYLSTRYFVYALQFITSISIAIKLGPYYYGIWGFILLLLNYFSTINLGISNSTNILLVQNKDDDRKAKKYVTSAMTLLTILSLFIISFGVYYAFGEPTIFEKYQIGNLFYLVCTIAILQHFNTLFSGIYRVKNRLLELSIYQSCIPVLVFIAMFFAIDRTLLSILLGAYLLGHCISLCMFIFRKKIPFGGELNLADTRTLLSKGFYLFIYNCCFYLMLTSCSTIVSSSYQVEEYGYYSFAYTLGHSILLFLEAFTFIMFPKVIDKLHSPNYSEINKTITAIRVNYVSFAHGLMYIAFTFFPLFIAIIPKYSATLPALNITSLAILLSTNAFGYNSLLMAKNKEKTISLISLCSLLVCIACGLIIATVFHVSYMYVVFSVMLGYCVFSYFCVYFGKRFLNQSSSFKNVMKACFPLNLLCPYICALLISIFKLYWLSFLPLLIFIIMNISVIREILVTVKKIILKPNVIDV